jgi:hypothetical protein
MKSLALTKHRLLTRAAQIGAATVRERLRYTSRYPYPPPGLHGPRTIASATYPARSPTPVRSDPRRRSPQVSRARQSLSAASTYSARFLPEPTRSPPITWFQRQRSWNRHQLNQKARHDIRLTLGAGREHITLRLRVANQYRRRQHRVSPDQSKIIGLPLGSRNVTARSRWAQERSAAAQGPHTISITTFRAHAAASRSTRRSTEAAPLPTRFCSTDHTIPITTRSPSRCIRRWIR